MIIHDYHLYFQRLSIFFPGLTYTLSKIIKLFSGISILFTAIILLFTGIRASKHQAQTFQWTLIRRVSGL